MFKNHLLLLGAAVVLASCGGANKENSSSADTTGSETTATPIVIEQFWVSDSTLKTPESVLFDKERKVIYVSNVNGMPTDKDKNGFISKLSPEGKIEILEWVKGLDAPKGMGVYKNKLYVTDITRLVEIDIDKGAIVKIYEVPGAKFLNDVTIDPAGLVYFSDTEANKIHTLSDGKVTTWLEEGLKGPNGLLIENNRLLLASFGGQDFKSIDLATKEATDIATEIGAGDGVVYFGEQGHYVVSDWEGTIFLIEPDGKKNLVLDTKADKINSADIDFVAETNMLLVPTFFNNRVVAYKLTHHDAE